MRWSYDRSGSPRLFFNSLSELDEECERMVDVTYFRRRDTPFVPPLDDDTLQVLVEDDADLDLYCEMEPGVEAYTEFRPGRRPLIKVSATLSETPNRRLRLRTTLAHEWFHARYHGVAWEKMWAERRIRGLSSDDMLGKCSHEHIIGAPDSIWPEFQAGYASCALLMPKTWVQRDLAELPLLGVTNFDMVVQQIANKYEVSIQAARYRLQQLGFHRQLRLC